MSAMRLARLFALGLLLLSSLGCLSDRENRLSRFRSITQSTSPDALYLDYVVVERPIGDHILDQKIWNEIDEMVIAVDSRPSTKGNGFRIGVMGGLISPDLQSLIKNPKNQQGVRRRQVQTNVAKNINIGNSILECEFQVTSPGEEKNI